MKLQKEQRICQARPAKYFIVCSSVLFLYTNQIECHKHHQKGLGQSNPFPLDFNFFVAILEKKDQMNGVTDD